MTMEDKKRGFVLMGVAAVAVAIGAFVFLNSNSEEATPEVKGAIYYTGPIKSKGGDVWATPDGQIVERPSDGTTPAAPNEGEAKPGNSTDRPE